MQRQRRHAGLPLAGPSLLHGQAESSACLPFIVWCRRRDSNSHGFRHRPLKTACLPISPRRQFTTSASRLGMPSDAQSLHLLRNVLRLRVVRRARPAAAALPRRRWRGAAGLLDLDACPSRWSPAAAVPWNQVRPRLVRKNTAASTAVLRLRKLAEPDAPNRLPEAPLPKAAPMSAPLPCWSSTRPTDADRHQHMQQQHQDSNHL